MTRMAVVAALSLLVVIQPALAVAQPYAPQTDRLIDRIEKAADWVAQQSIVYGGAGLAFAGETNNFHGRLYTDLSARVAWMFQNFYQHLTSRKHEMRLKATVDFVLSGQAPTKDFYEYYDTEQQIWKNAGQLCHWNPHVSAMLSLSAMNMRRLPESTIKHEYWRQVIDRIEAFVEAWLNTGLYQEGVWVFSYPDGTGQGIAENGMMLATLASISAYELMWGSQVKAMRYSVLAQRTAGWILNRQEMDPSRWGWGGFYEDEARTKQVSLSNAKVMHGILAYWEFIGVTVEDKKNLYDMLRERLVAWAEGFFGNMRDEFGGPYFERTAIGTNKYPKKTLEAAEFMRDIAIIWIDHGEARYWNWTEFTYRWLRGDNEARFDLQQAVNLNGQAGGFYAGIQNATTLDYESTTLITAVCVEAMLYALYIDVPEFQRPHLAMATLVVALLLTVRRRRRSSNIADITP